MVIPRFTYTRKQCCCNCFWKQVRHLHCLDAAHCCCVFSVMARGAARRNKKFTVEYMWKSQRFFSLELIAPVYHPFSFSVLTFYLYFPVPMSLLFGCLPIFLYLPLLLFIFLWKNLTCDRCNNSALNHYTTGWSWSWKRDKIISSCIAICVI